MSLQTGDDGLRRAKAELRMTIRDRIAALSRSERRRADDAIADRLSAAVSRLGAVAVLGYVALPDEVCIDAFLASMVASGLEVLLPRLAGSTAAWARWTPRTQMVREKGRFLAPRQRPGEGGIPAGAVVIVPGRAFDLRGRRLGRGAGFYDRMLGGAQALRTIGVAYRCQMVEEVPSAAHDVAMSSVVTDEEARNGGG
ncbi:MAG TPA: 5-formyltetrahydrofolate cyclo-ligase [Candidatus Binatia bacterium]|jgi:5-formyltetrahydrofolate cyclo-ligase